MTTSFRRPSRRSGFPLLWLAAVLLLLCQPTHAIKFAVQAARFPAAKCIWNAAHPGALVIRNVYLSKKNISGEKRFAITAHSDEDVGVCFRNYLDPGKQGGPVEAKPRSRVIDLDIDIGADAVDYNAIANQESLSGLETEMRKLEGVVKEIVDEMDYLKSREERFQTTNMSTNTRVQNFAWFTLFSLVALGLWQIFHLRAFFKRKYLID
ncbi:emp24/gp25L/p24 family/GOLD-domain-containing protein [Fomitopsis serialis]|uniref:emp24/gp25L/p24 family/GOLD-domain-containing protein n=1 Tax=Fomitopsis serialis TaxID=139415 RepID=UPI002007E3AD|nr:emp24/gp25L/p24 family/GOLD-domain-containing protein [Neoantrodia serialis]KAH9932979.1 emp24/gp25L/p24 family/GOLD-domain-containing protein [Neoantrodia serialis]